MNCSRCLGLMIEDQYLDMESQYGQMWARSLRCVNCGYVHDSVIEQNRLARQEQVVAHPSGEPDYQDDEVHLGVESIIRRAARSRKWLTRQLHLLGPQVDGALAVSVINVCLNSFVNVVKIFGLIGFCRKQPTESSRQIQHSLEAWSSPDFVDTFGA